MILSLQEFTFFIEGIVSSPITNVILTLLLLFQWYRADAKEQSVKNNLLGIRRMLSRLPKWKAYHLTDALDATLATLDTRLPFVVRLHEVLDGIKKRFRSESEKVIELVPNEEDILKS